MVLRNHRLGTVDSRTPQLPKIKGIRHQSGTAAIRKKITPNR
tara:strand:- start:4357 stop:4482 length:126 start_codon:yes stop_codon:yes gene_type:complete